MSNSATLSFARLIAKQNGMTFKAYEDKTFNGKPLYHLIDRKSKNTVCGNIQLCEVEQMIETGEFLDIAVKNGCIA